MAAVSPFGSTGGRDCSGGLDLSRSPSGKRRRRASNDHDADDSGGGGGGCGGMASGGSRRWGSSDDWPATPVTHGEGAFGLLSPTSVMSPMQSFHHEESLMAANSAANRYKRECEAVMGKVKDMTRRLAASEAQVSVVARELQRLREDSRQKEAELQKRLDVAEASLRVSASAALLLEQSAGAGPQEGLVKELEASREEVKLLKSELENANAQCGVYKQRAEEGFVDVSESLAKLSSREGSDASSESLAVKVREYEIMNRNLKDALERTKEELEGANEVVREVTSLRKHRQDVDALQSKCAKLGELLDQATAEEAKAAAERDSLQHWKVSLSIGLPEQSTPAAVVEAFREARETHIKLEGHVHALDERVKNGEREREALREQARRDADRASKAEGRVGECEGGLLGERSHVERLKREVLDLKLMLQSFKAEEVLVRDGEVVALTESLKKSEAGLKEAIAAQAELKAQCDSTTAELAKNKQEVDRLRESQRKERELNGTNQAALQKQKADLQSQLDAERTASSAARNKARENEMTLRAKATDADRQIKVKAAEMERLAKAHHDELVKAQTEGAERLVEVENKLITAKTTIDGAMSKARKGEDLERILPSLVGVSVGCQYKKTLDKTVRELLVTTKSSLSAKPDTLFLKATIPTGDAAAPIKLSLSENGALKTGPMAEAFARRVSATAGTSAEHAGIPALLAGVTMQEFERLAAAAAAEPKEEAPAPVKEEPA